MNQSPDPALTQPRGPNPEPDLRERAYERLLLDIINAPDQREAAGAVAAYERFVEVGQLPDEAFITTKPGEIRLLDDEPHQPGRSVFWLLGVLGLVVGFFAGAITIYLYLNPNIL